MMGSRGCRGGDEYDAFTGWRRRINWKRGELRVIKRRFWKRTRKLARATARRDAAAPQS